MNQKVTDWILTLPQDIQHKINALRQHIITRHDDLIEAWSYGMPAYQFHKKSVFYFNVYQHHIGLYPHNKAIEVFSKQLTQYRTSKGAIQIPIDLPIPFKLIDLIIEYNKKNKS